MKEIEQIDFQADWRTSSREDILADIEAGKMALSESGIVGPYFLIMWLGPDLHEFSVSDGTASHIINGNPCSGCAKGSCGFEFPDGKILADYIWTDKGD
jgi:hypothetical protein